MWNRVSLLIFLLLVGGCSLSLIQQNEKAGVMDDGITMSQILPDSLEKIEKSDFEGQYMSSDMATIRNKHVQCLQYKDYFVYNYLTGKLKIFTTRSLDREQDIFSLYSIEKSIYTPLSSTLFSGFASCGVENGELIKIKRDGALLDEYPTKGEIKSIYKNTMPDVLFEMAQGRYDKIWAYRFGKNFNMLLLQNKAQYFLLGEKKVKPHSQNREFCHTQYSLPTTGSSQEQYYEKLLFRSENDIGHYYLLEYSLPTDRPDSKYGILCPPPIFIDVADA